MIGKVLVPYYIYATSSKIEITNLLNEIKKRYCVMSYKEDNVINCMVFYFNASNEKYKFVKVLSLKEIYYSKGEIK